MSIDIKELLKTINLTEDQQAAIGTVQSQLDQRLQTTIESEKKGLLSKNEELISKLQKAKAKQLPDGVDASQYDDFVKGVKEAKKAAKKAEEEKLIASQNWETLKKEMNQTHSAELRQARETSEKEINSLRKTLDNQLIENNIIKALEKENGSKALLMPHLKLQTQTVKDEDGNFNVVVVDEKGNPRNDPSTGEPIGVEQLVAEFKAKEEYAPAFPVQNSGSGNGPNINQSYNGKENPFDKNSKSYSLTAQAQLNKSNPALAKTLKEQAMVG